MTLLEHLKESGQPIATFAASINEAENTIRKIAYGQRQPSLPLAVKISAATKGAVAPGDMLLEAAAPLPTDTREAA